MLNSTLKPRTNSNDAYIDKISICESQLFSALRLFKINGCLDTITVSHCFVEKPNTLFDCLLSISKSQCFTLTPNITNKQKPEKMGKSIILSIQNIQKKAKDQIFYSNI